jgi:hypothetical protein
VRHLLEYVSPSLDTLRGVVSNSIGRSGCVETTQLPVSEREGFERAAQEFVETMRFNVDSRNRMPCLALSTSTFALAALRFEHHGIPKKAQ